MSVLRMVPGLLVLSCLLVLPGEAKAQRGGPPVRLTVAPTEVLFPSPTSLDFETQWVYHDGVSIQVEPLGNRQNWQVFVEATAADMGGYGKPVEDVQVMDGAGDWIPLSNAGPQLIAEGTNGATTITIYYRLRLNWSDDIPGTYSVPLVYTGQTF